MPRYGCDNLEYLNNTLKSLDDLHDLIAERKVLYENREAFTTGGGRMQEYIALGRYCLDSFAQLMFASSTVDILSSENKVETKKSVIDRMKYHDEVMKPE